MQIKPTKPGTKAKQDKTIDELVQLYEKKYNKKLNKLERMIVLGQIALYKDSDKSEAKAKVRGSDRGPSLRDTSVLTTDPEKVKTALEKSYGVLDEQAQYAVEARTTAKEFTRVAGEYQKALRPLTAAFRGLSDMGMGDIDDKARDIAESLDQADRLVTEYKVALGFVVTEANNLQKTVLEIRERNWVRTAEEARGLPVLTSEQLKAVENAEKKLADTVQKANDYGQSKTNQITTLIREMSAKIIAWRKGKEFNKNVDRFETLANGAVSTANTVNAEPLSHTALQGIHALIHASCDGLKLLRNTIKASELNAQGKGDIDKLLDQLKGDDFIQWKLDMIQMGLRWVTEPLGFVPTAGELIRSAVDAAVAAVIGIIKDAAKSQAKDALKNSIPTVKKTITEVLREKTEEGAKNAAKAIYEEAQDKALELGDVMDKLSKGPEGVAEVIVGSVIKIAGEALSPLLEKVIPSMKMLDKEQIKSDLAASRKAAVDMNAKAKKMASIQTTFTLDDNKVKARTKDVILGLTEGKTAPWLLILSPELKKSGGYALLVGAGHDPASEKFADTLLEAGHGWEGTVTAGSTGKVYFDCDDPKAREGIKSYWNNYSGISERELQLGSRKPKVKIPTRKN